MPSLNRLAHEKSLYLRQHAANPVDWYPWGPEAVQRARELDRPILLSIGYSACHWCHVMEHESFMDPDTAELLNRHFVAIKVDREERPDLDAIYMQALQLLTREGGGWPLNVFLTPQLQPFYAGTYYPPDERYAPHRPSFKRLLRAIIEAWQTQRDQIESIGQNVALALQQMHAATLPAAASLNESILQQALRHYQQLFDPVHGGFGSAPKFPHAVDLQLLLRLQYRYPDSSAGHMAAVTLDRMARGGIYDQLGGGFARYSVDARWLVPHFEKMLYDNALLARTYTQAWQLQRSPEWRQVASETLDYVLRDMTDPCGAFYSSEDADSEGEEGKYYLFDLDEVKQVLGEEDARFACAVWDITASGNFEGRNILHRSGSDAEDAARLGLPLEAFQSRLRGIKQRLLEYRQQRVRPGRDEKILTAWNALMITALAEAGAAFDEPRYREAARRAADAILRLARDPQGRLLRVAITDPQSPQRPIQAYLEDYAYLAEAAATLYECCYELEYLKIADELLQQIWEQFADPAGGGLYFVPHDHEPLIVRPRDQQDGSTPSGAAVAATVWLRLARLLDRRDYREKAENILKAYEGLMREHPMACAQSLIALDWYIGPVEEVAIIGRAGAADTRTALAAIHRAFRPRQVRAFHDPAAPPPAALIPWLADKPMVGDTVTVYPCQDYQCGPAVVGVEAITTRWS